MLIQYQVVRIDHTGRVIKSKGYSTLAAARGQLTKTKKKYPARHIFITPLYTVPARSMFDHILSEGVFAGI